MMADLLYPLSLFCQDSGHPLPAYEVIEGRSMPQPYEPLLVHSGDMTSKLEEFHNGAINLRVLHRETDGDVYRREVLLCVQQTGLPVEYGAIEIDLAAFDPALRELILEGRLPLGGVLNQHGVRYRSEPRAFVRLSPNAAMTALFELPGAVELYGRVNVLLSENGARLARIVEVLRPAEPAAP